MSTLLKRVRINPVPSEFAEKKLSKVLELYLNWYDDDIAAAKAAMVQDELELNESKDGGIHRAGIIKTIIEANG